ncbi:helix-turn-helix domain-containing protein [Streptomyces hainanensis]|uniref:XRE family transcriptional regulator n=1 Tax=Streptomyces hainanensis TaxID=402648 RepID=A0A4R4TTJ8_9ACTN|nr:helix-turn-helix transcriptional regulator [Streptomyces hainanensis]TDC78483.1 XRE family transcriptional regulator [Streptomyces hainanensis]
MPSSTSVQEARKALGQRLREMRKDSGITARELARRAGWHESKCSRLENGKATPSEGDIRVWSRLCGADGETDDLIATARGIEGMYVEWRRLCRSGLRQLQNRSVPLYERTRRFRVYEPGVIPGLFQTADYARALMGAIISFEGYPDDTETAVAARMARQRVVYEGDHRFAVLLEESVLRARIGGPDVMAAQLGHLLVAANLPRVSLGIIPSSVDRAMWPVEGFWIFDEELIKVELATAGVTVTQPREIAIYARTFKALADMAVYGAGARSVITEAINALSRA